MKPDLQIYFDAKSIESLVGTIREAPDVLPDPSAESEEAINNTPGLLSFFHFKRSKGRPIRLPEQTIHASRALFYSKYDSKELSEWTVLITAGDSARWQYKLHESEVFYNHALEVAQRFLPSDVIAHSLLSVYWSHYLYAWCKGDEASIDKAIISSEALMQYLKKNSADYLRNELINGLHFYIDPRIEMLKYLNQHDVKPTNSEEQDLKILQNVLNKYLECNYNHNHSVFPTRAAATTNLNYKSGLKEPQNVLSYRCRMYLPKDHEDDHFIPEPSYAPRNDNEVDRLSSADLHGILYDMVSESCYPDPPNYHIARWKDWFRIVDPGLFQDGAIKETIKERLFYFLKDRERILKSHCKENRLDLSSFPLPVLTKVKEPKFRHFGPKNTRIDEVDRWLRQIDFRVAFFIRAITVTTLLEGLLILNFLLAAPLWTQLKFLLIAITVFVVVEMPVRYFSCKSALRRAGSEPIIRPAETELTILLSDLKDWGRSLASCMPGALRMPDLRNVKTTIFRSHPHPDKKAYSISIVSEVIIKSKIFSTFIGPKKITLNIEIVGQGVNGPHIFIFWFDSPKSIFLARQSLQIINYVRDEICRLLTCRLDSHEKFVCLPGDKKSFRYYEDRVLIQYSANRLSSNEQTVVVDCQERNRLNFSTYSGPTEVQTRAASLPSYNRLPFLYHRPFHKHLLR